MQGVFYICQKENLMTKNNQSLLLKQVYKQADDFFAAKPWELFDEADIFGVRSPDTGKEYFISIMGAGGEVFSFAAYEGREALYKFWNIHMLGEAMPPSYLMSIPYLMVSLDEPEYVDPQKKKQLKKLGVKSRDGLLPNISKMEPGRLPQDLSDTELKDMLHVLKQALHVVEESRTSNKANIHSDQDDDVDYLFRLVEGKDSKWVSKKIKVPPPTIKTVFTLHDNVLEDFMKAPEYNEPVEIDLQLLPSPIKDEEKGIFFPALLLAVDPQTEVVLFMETVQPFPDYKEMLTILPDVIMRKSLEIGKKIMNVQFRTFDLEGVFYFLRDKTGMKVQLVDELEAIDNAFQFFHEHIFSGQGDHDQGF